MQYYNDAQLVIDNVDFLFVSRCMLMEGHELFLKLRLQDLADMLQQMHDAPEKRAHQEEDVRTRGR